MGMVSVRRAQKYRSGLALETAFVDALEGRKGRSYRGGGVPANVDLSEWSIRILVSEKACLRVRSRDRMTSDNMLDQGYASREAKCGSRLWDCRYVRNQPLRPSRKPKPFGAW